MIATLRRLDDLERYWGFTWPGWAGIAAGCVTLYLAVRFSPLSFKPTVTITLFVCAFVGMVLYGVSGQALSPSRQLWAVAAYIASPKRVALDAKPQRRGLALVAIARANHEFLDEHPKERAALVLGRNRRKDSGATGQLDRDVHAEYAGDHGWDLESDVHDLDEADVDELEASRVDTVSPADQHDARGGALTAGDEPASPGEKW